MTEVGIGLGSNLGDRCGNIIAALKLLAAHPQISLTQVSSIFDTPPWGVTDQPTFLNAAALIETSLSAADLLGVCKDIEATLGRTIRQRWGPREIDIDLLFCADAVISTPTLTLPHARLFERLFVLAPLHEIMDERRVAGRDLNDVVSRLGQVEPMSGIVPNLEATARLRSAL